MKRLITASALAASFCLSGCAGARLTAEEHESLLREARAASVLAYRAAREEEKASDSAQGPTAEEQAAAEWPPADQPLVPYIYVDFPDGKVPPEAVKYLMPEEP